MMEIGHTSLEKRSQTFVSWSAGGIRRLLVSASGLLLGTSLLGSARGYQQPIGELDDSNVKRSDDDDQDHYAYLTGYFGGGPSEGNQDQDTPTFGGSKKFLATFGGRKLLGKRSHDEVTEKTLAENSRRVFQRQEEHQYPEEIYSKPIIHQTDRVRQENVLTRPRALSKVARKRQRKWARTAGVQKELEKLWKEDMYNFEKDANFAAEQKALLARDLLALENSQL